LACRASGRPDPAGGEDIGVGMPEQGGLALSSRRRSRRPSPSPHRRMRRHFRVRQSELSCPIRPATAQRMARVRGKRHHLVCTGIKGETPQQIILQCQCAPHRGS
jgi:hypothetical protein